ncbi:4-hydroxy-tetrahydrodipicolinate synthase [Streptomyces cyanogenus]|uniref:4-hydroxy-tetrahydrodipicolinate synthase n=1 Tax=Streptomyces cyanogenus TaxID=80860 RepID=A0ABX7TTG6_STRCY|nr:4-hydroxy-tetrahydrodipicolinate synthase [Streptomyces cyanogenus]QTD99711.1 4-hydroxy-tetrahydrodipicolinate synthase [Streptomyces cyanogenus]
MEGVYLPLVTPFYDGAVDLVSLRRLVEHYRHTGIAGLVMLGTTGESPTIEPDEQKSVVAATLDAVAGELPVYVGVGGNSTRHVASALAAYESMNVAGYLVVTPYYNRPSADGLVEHFRAVAGETERTLIAYNVPYRTGVNLSNDALLELAATVPNIRAVKDATGNIVQSLDLLERAPQDLAVLTGEDPLYFTSLANGAAGGILASAHLATATFVEVADAIAGERLVKGRTAWRSISPLIPALFREANPMPLKYCLWRLGLIRSPECRLPLTRVSEALAAQLDDLVAGLSSPGATHS